MSFLRQFFFQPHLISCLIYSNTCSVNPFSNTLTLCSFLNSGIMTIPNFTSIRHFLREVTRKIMQADEGAWVVRLSLTLRRLMSYIYIYIYIYIYTYIYIYIWSTHS